MSENFDPYRRWLGIRDATRPPNHYRLLGVELFEDDPAVLESSADRQMGHLRTFQSGQHSSLSQQLLNEVASAKICLLNPKTKAAYDAQLRGKLEISSIAPSPAPKVLAPSPGLASGPKPPSAFTPAKLTPPPAVESQPAAPGAGPSFAGIADPLAGGPAVRDEYRRLLGPNTLLRASLVGWTMMMVAIVVVWTWFWPDIPEQGEVTVERRIFVREKPKSTKPPKVIPKPEGPPALEELEPLGKHKTGVWALAVSPDGKKAITAGTDRIVRVWDIAKSEELLETVADDLLYSVAFAPSGEKVALAGVDGIVREWDITADESPLEAFRHAGEALCVAISPDGNLLASGGKEGTLLIHRLPDYPRVHRLEAHSAALHALAFSPDSRRLATAGGEGAVRIWNLESGEQERSIEAGSAPITALAWSRDGSILISGAKDGAVHIWDARTGQPKLELSGHTDMVRALVLTPDGRQAVTTGADRSIRVWDLATGEEVARSSKHSAAVFGLALLPGDRVMSASADATVRTWKLPAPPPLEKN